jgi:hypothetical protein
MSATKHDWHIFDELRGIQVRQATGRLRANRWEVRHGQRVAALTDEQFDQLRAGGPLPDGLGDG